MRRGEYKQTVLYSHFLDLLTSETQNPAQCSKRKSDICLVVKKSILSVKGEKR